MRPDIFHRFQRPTSLVALDVDLGPFARGPMYLVCAKPALDIPRIRKVAGLLEAELAKVQGARRLKA